MKKESSTRLGWSWPKKIISLILGLAVFSVAAKPVLAQETVFGPEDVYISWFRIHFSFHTFTIDDPGEGTIIIRKNTPAEKIEGGIARLNGKWISLLDFLGGDDLVFEKSVTLRSRNYLYVSLRGARGASISVEVKNKSLTQPPEVNFSANPSAIKLGEASTLNWATSYTTAVSIEPGIGSVGPSGSQTVTPTETTTYTLTAKGEGGTTSKGATVSVINPPPTVSMSASPEDILYGESVALSWSSTHATSANIEPGIGSVASTDSTTVTPERTTTYTITATGPGGRASAQTVVTVTADVEPPPEGSFGDRYQDQIPSDATIGEYDSSRFSLITGLVQNLDNVPLADVAITILDHPEYGTALTDPNGRFSIPVEGGGTLTVVYQKEGLIASQRKVYVPWNDVAISETIQMIAGDPVATTVTFDGNSSTVVTHQSTQASDEFGSRSLTMVFTGDNSAHEVDAHGNVIRELSTITTRATEFPTLESMPAILPPTSAFTYCAELTVDGAQRVKFDKPIITWLDNFLGFDVGEAVPVGYYDRDRGVWVPEDNGIVVALLDTNADGFVDALDSNGDGAPDDLDGDAVFSDEVLGLDDSARYQPGSTFWRVALTHFTTIDYNWPAVVADTAIDPNPTTVAKADQKTTSRKDCQRKTSSFVEERSRIFHEDIPIPGTDITLHYSSDRVEGYQHKITVPASGESVPASLKRIIVRLEVAGRFFQQNLDPFPNQMVEFIWDGLDHLGRQVSGSTTAHVSVGFVYDAVYAYADARAGGIGGSFVRAFGQPGREATLISAREEIILWKRSTMILHRRAQGGGELAEGWTVSPHHVVNPTDTSVLHKGDGTQAVNQAIIIRRSSSHRGISFLF
jgi:hypothetical protein